MLPGRKGYVGVTAKDNRTFINGVIWIFKTGAPWRDLPERYGHWKIVHLRFSRWSRAGIFDRIFQTLSEDADMEFLLIDIAFQINILVKMIVPLEANPLLASPAGGRGKIESEHHCR